jgi:hypothetical protein
VTDPEKNALGVVARDVLSDLAAAVGSLRGNYPGLSEGDWHEVQRRVLALAQPPAEPAYRDAYATLERRAEAAR